MSRTGQPGDLTFLDIVFCSLCCRKQRETRDVSNSKKAGRCKLQFQEPAEEVFRPRFDEEEQRHTEEQSKPASSVLKSALRRSGLTEAAPIEDAAPLVRPGENSAERRAQEMLDDFEEMASQIKCRCQKYPKGGISMFSNPQERYFAVMPAPEDGDAGAGSSRRCGPKAELQRWRRGRLAYWEDKQAYEKNAAEKGHIELSKIAKVSANKEDSTGLSVIVKHKQGQKFCELVLKFGTKREADQWNYAFHKFVEKQKQI